MALMVTSVFLFQNCATIISGTSQKIPVTSNPSGAKIIVDGIEVGNAPLNLKKLNGLGLNVLILGEKKLLI
ncbi:MAG: PEGA domain-containing protein [Candidatus Aminicenantes bacterium]|nr:PEGA domain-containing protein [Candidatus Aminicenantes bacterium]